MDNKKIYKFAIKWRDKFMEEDIDYTHLVGKMLADECKELGFIMDCGKSFIDRYPKAFNDYRILEDIIDNVDDMKMLGSAIYSQWRYYNHWAYNSADILKTQNRKWFVLAFNRLASLTGENPFVFSGEPLKIRIISNTIHHGPMPNPEDEIEQRFTMDSDGNVSFASYAFGSGIHQHKQIKSDNWTIDKDDAKKILMTLASYFGRENKAISCEDAGHWYLEMTNTAGKDYVFKGSLCKKLILNKVDISELIRDTLNMYELYLFDENTYDDRIDKILIEYERNSQTINVNKNISSCAMIDNKGLVDYSEHLIIDRKQDEIQYIRNISKDCILSNSYKIKDGISALLDEISDRDLLSKKIENDKKVERRACDDKHYRVVIDYKIANQKIISGSFDKHGLPDGWAEFADRIYHFINFYGDGEILSPCIYNKVRRRSDEYIYCSVIFENPYKTYYYLTDDDNITVDDWVLVQTGKNEDIHKVKVVNIEYFTEETAPIPIENMNKIVKKFI